MYRTDSKVIEHRYEQTQCFAVMQGATKPHSHKHTAFERALATYKPVKAAAVVHPNTHAL
jgi:hypothetical protein